MYSSHRSPGKGYVCGTCRSFRVDNPTYPTSDPTKYRPIDLSRSPMPRPTDIVFTLICKVSAAAKTTVTVMPILILGKKRHPCSRIGAIAIFNSNLHWPFYAIQPNSISIYYHMCVVGGPMSDPIHQSQLTYRRPTITFPLVLSISTLLVSILIPSWSRLSFVSYFRGSWLHVTRPLDFKFVKSLN